MLLPHVLSYKIHPSQILELPNRKYGVMIFCNLWNCNNTANNRFSFK